MTAPGRSKLELTALDAVISTFPAGKERERMYEAILREFRDWTPPVEQTSAQFAVQVRLPDVGWIYVFDQQTLKPRVYGTWEGADLARSLWNEENSRVVKAPAPL